MTSATGPAATAMEVDAEEKDLVTFDQSALFLGQLQSFVHLARSTIITATA